MHTTPFHNLRRLSALGAFLLVTCGPAFGQDAASDEKVIAEMGQRLSAVQRQILQSHDYAEQARLQGSLGGIIEETLPKLSEKARVPLQITLKIVMPMQDQMGAYLRMIADYSASPESDLSGIAKIEDIAARRKILGKLQAMNDSIIVRLENILPEATKMINASDMSATDKRNFLAGFAQGMDRKIGPTRAVRNLDVQLFQQLLAALDHLEKNWGKWQVAKGQPFTWTDPELEKTFREILAQISLLAERQMKAQQVLLERT